MNPRVVSQSDWQKEMDEITRQEKELTRLNDQLSAKRRRLPMYQVRSDYVFDTPEGKKSFVELFDGRQQLVVYHFMFDPEWDKGCPGCSWVVDAMSHPAHLESRGITIVNVARAPLKKVMSYQEQMGWGQHSWASSFESDFNKDMGATKDFGEDHGMSVFFRDGEKTFRTYVSFSRGVEYLGCHYTYLDRTPFGRKEKWEDSPEGWPQFDNYVQDRRHNEYETDGRQ